MLGYAERETAGACGIYAPVETSNTLEKRASRGKLTVGMLLVLTLSSHSVTSPPGRCVYIPRLALGLLLLHGVSISVGQFSEAAQIYSEAIEQAPAHYLLYYKRATASSLQRNTTVLDDFDKVLSLTSNTFDNAHLMKARIHARERHFDLAKPSLKLYVKAKGKSSNKDNHGAEELEKEISEG